MSILNQTNLTLLDHAKRMDPDGKTATVAELLSQTNDILTDMVWKEGNLETGHRVTIRTGLPSVYWRLVNQGVPNSKSRTAQVDEGTGILEARSQVDVDLAMLNGNTSSFRLSEGRAFLEAMNQEMSGTVFYGNSSVNPQEFNGLGVRYSSLSAGNAQNIISGGAAGGQTDCMSIWLVAWGDETVHGIFPKGSKAGLIHKDLGEGDAFDADGNRFRAYMDQWQWKAGIVVKDWRYVVRIANIDKSVLVANTAPADLLQLMTKAMHRLPSKKLGKPVFYMNRTVAEFLDIQRYAAVKAGGGLTYQNVDGQEIPYFRGAPIRTVDQLTEAESVVA